MSKHAVIAAVSLSEPRSTVFDLWAQVYDVNANPMLALEERNLTTLLPNVCGANVLDVGCGTGRWLHRLEALQPASLTGVDCSSAMLERAREKCASSVHLIQGDSSSLPVAKGTQDLIVSSFVLSYLEDLFDFGRECARVLKPGGYLLLSDLHPATAEERGWSRSFSVDGQSIHLAARSASISEIIATFDAAGFNCCALLEPSFELSEQAIFKQAGKLADYISLEGVPAIYLLKLQKRITTNLQLTNARWSADAVTWMHTDVWIEDGFLSSTKSEEMLRFPLDLSGYVLLPGLINAHDHLEFALFPNLGRSSKLHPYANSAEWAREIHDVHASTIALHLQVPLETRLWWGAIRNLLCGVSTVCHHNPIHPELVLPDFPVRVVTDFGWSHSLAFDQDIAERFQATPVDRPFILHAAEGIDQQSRDEVIRLDEMGILGSHTVLVHGLALTAEDVPLLNQHGASLILCPTSNKFLFGQAPLNTFVQAVERVALGSDSPLTAAGDLLDEVRFLHGEQGLDARMLYQLITTNPAEILHLREGAGRLQHGCGADLIAVREFGLSPAETLAHLSFVEVELVLLAGSVQLASAEIYARLPRQLQSGLHPLEIEGQQRWIRADLPALFKSAEEVLVRGNLRLGGKEVRHLSTL